VKAWVLKFRSYRGGDSVIWDYDTEDEAKAEADRRNEAYQSDTFYVERWDPEKYGPWLTRTE
jgi:hypothetical protein